MVSRDLREQLKGVLGAIGDAYGLWQHQMDMWSQEPAGVEMPRLAPLVEANIQRLFGLDEALAEDYVWMLAQ